MSPSQQSSNNSVYWLHPLIPTAVGVFGAFLSIIALFMPFVRAWIVDVALIRGDGMIFIWVDILLLISFLTWKIVDEPVYFLALINIAITIFEIWNVGRVEMDSYGLSTLGSGFYMMIISSIIVLIGAVLVFISSLQKQR